MNLKEAYVKVYIPDGYRRSWRSLWRRRPVERVLFIGRVTAGQYQTQLNAGANISGLAAVDAITDLVSR